MKTELSPQVQRRKQRYKLAKSIIDRQFEAVRRKLRLRETGGGGFCGGSDADDVDRELAKLRGMMHEMSLLGTVHYCFSIETNANGQSGSSSN